MGRKDGKTTAEKTDNTIETNKSKDFGERRETHMIRRQGQTI